MIEDTPRAGTPAMSPLTRRALVCALPAAVAAPVAFASTERYRHDAHTSDPIVAMFEEWHRVVTFLDGGSHGLTDDEFGAMHDVNIDLHDRICRTMPTTNEGAACLMQMCLDDDLFHGGGYCDGREIALARNLVAYLRGEPEPGPVFDGPGRYEWRDGRIMDLVAAEHAPGMFHERGDRGTCWADVFCRENVVRKVRPS
jgi:hypothetical protein